MDYCSSSGAVEPTLHSNLVIFKLNVPFESISPFDLYIPIWLYSNDILENRGTNPYCLYIPIWLYSNWYAVGFTLELDFLYIPIWLYSNF